MYVNCRIESNTHQKFHDARYEIWCSSALKIKAAGSFKIWYPSMKLSSIQLSSRSEQISLLQGLIKLHIEMEDEMYKGQERGHQNKLYRSKDEKIF